MAEGLTELTSPTFENNRALSGPPSAEEVAALAAKLYKHGVEATEEEKLAEARRRLLASRVWNNEWIFALITVRSTDDDKITRLAKTEKRVEKFVMDIIVFQARLSWRMSGAEEFLGEPQVVVMTKNGVGEVHVCPKKGFHPTIMFDWD